GDVDERSTQVAWSVHSDREHRAYPARVAQHRLGGARHLVGTRRHPAYGAGRASALASCAAAGALGLVVALYSTAWRCDLCVRERCGTALRWNKALSRGALPAAAVAVR